MRIVILPDLIYHAISHLVFNMFGLPILNVPEHTFTLGVVAPPENVYCWLKHVGVAYTKCSGTPFYFRSYSSS